MYILKHALSERTASVLKSIRARAYKTRCLYVNVLMSFIVRENFEINCCLAGCPYTLQLYVTNYQVFE